MDELNGSFEANKDMLEQRQMLNDCEKRGSKLTERESDFIDSLANRICRGYTITDRQAERLLKIYNRVTG